MKKYDSFKSFSESTLIIIAIGISFMSMGLAHSLNYITINSSLLLSISISSILFTLADLMSIGTPTNLNNFMKQILLFLSIFTLLFFPYIFQDSPTNEILATSYSIIAIGITIVNLALKQHQNNEHLLSLLEKQSANAYNAIKKAEEATTLAEKINNNNNNK